MIQFEQSFAKSASIIERRDSNGNFQHFAVRIDTSDSDEFLSYDKPVLLGEFTTRNDALAAIELTKAILRSADDVFDDAVAAGVKEARNDDVDYNAACEQIAVAAVKAAADELADFIEETQKFTYAAVKEAFGHFVEENNLVEKLKKTSNDDDEINFDYYGDEIANVAAGAAEPDYFGDYTSEAVEEAFKRFFEERMS